MRIIIAGAGKVGFYLAKSLSVFHDVIILDKNTKTINNIKESLDVLAVDGNICNSKVYENFDSSEIDYFIAVTDSDEANIVASMVIDEKLTVKRKILRLKNNFYKNNHLSKLDIFKSVYPSIKIAKSMKYLLKYPEANNVKKFNDMDTFLLSIRAVNVSFLGLSVAEIEERFENRVKIVGIEHKNRFFIPQATDKIKSGNLVYIFGNKADIKENYFFFNRDFKSDFEFKSTIIFGASRVGIELARVLISNSVRVKIIEKDLNLCNIAQDELNGDAVVLHSRYGWGHILKEEDLDSADMFIAASEDDEFNIIKSLEAKQADIFKVIAINNQSEYYQLMHSLGISTIRGEKIDAFYSILESINSDVAINQMRYCGGSGIVLYKEIQESSKCIEERLNIPSKIAEVAQVYLVSNKSVLKNISTEICEEGDNIVVFCSYEYDDIVEKWLYKEL